MANFEIFNPGTDGFGRLCCAADMLNQIDESGIFYSVQNTYWDFGADLKWTTIIAHQYRMGKERSWQVLYPREHKIITDAHTAEELKACIAEIHERETRMFGKGA